MATFTIDMVKDKIYSIFNTIEIISDDYNPNVKLNCKCSICGHIWDTSYKNLRDGRGCLNCVGTTKMSIEKIRDRLRLSNPNLEILSNEYKNAHSLLDFYCNDCNKIFKSRWNTLSNGRGCSNCNNKKSGNARKRTIESIKSELVKINRNIEIVSEKYVNSSSKLICHCFICENNFSVQWDYLKQGYKCPYCSNNLPISIEEIKNKVKQVNKNIEILTIVKKDNKNKLLVRCLIDGREWVTTYSRLMKGKGCAKCANMLRLSIEEVKSRLCSINPNIKLMSNDYINSSEKLDCECLVCENQWKVNWADLSQGYGCPECGKINAGWIVTGKHRVRSRS